MMKELRALLRRRTRAERRGLFGSLALSLGFFVIAMLERWTELGARSGHTAAPWALLGGMSIYIAVLELHNLMLLDVVRLHDAARPLSSRSQEARKA